MNKRFVGALALAMTLCGCGTNPVTGKREIQFISEAGEIQIGQQYYAPTRQSEGGDYTVLPDLTVYVNEVGQKIAAVSDRPLPYEFTVLNSSVPNAWALPGGKIAINRGLLTELKNEAELAAVLGHEVVHAAARHGAKAQERGTLFQVGLAAAQIGAAVGGVDDSVAGLVLGGAGVGAQLVQSKYGRDQELESDLYGMRYMKKAGYDPQGAVTLQETFVRLSQGRQTAWLDGLFASHPPSPERVTRNRETAALLGAGGDLGVERYRARLQPLDKIVPAYKKYDDALAALQKKDHAKARSLASEAAKMVPKEGSFHQLLGDIEVSAKQPKKALTHYEKAVANSPGYFGSYLGYGIAQYELGNRSRAEELLRRSADLLPTAPAAYYLGNAARDRGDRQGAMKFYQSAASSQSSMGQQAAAEMVRIDLPQNPGNYVATGLALGSRGQAVMAVQNRTGLPLADIRITPVLVDAGGRVLQQGQLVTIAGPLAAGAQITRDAGLSGLTQEQLQGVRFKVESARIAN